VVLLFIWQTFHGSKKYVNTCYRLRYDKTAHSKSFLAFCEFL